MLKISEYKDIIQDAIKIQAIISITGLATVASEIDHFFGGWSDDPRSTDDIMKQIRDGRVSRKR